MTSHSNSWRVFVKQNIGSAAKLAALLNVHRNTANAYIRNPLAMTIAQFSDIVQATGVDKKELFNIINNTNESQ